MLNVSTKTKTKAPPGTAHGHVMLTQIPQTACKAHQHGGSVDNMSVTSGVVLNLATVLLCGSVHGQHLLTVTVINVFIYVLSGD